jgi:2-methylcitrate dehydratase PrpD
MQEDSPLSRQLARYIASFRFESLPPEVLRHARLMLADTIAVALAAEQEEVIAKVRRYAAAEGGSAALWNTTARSSAATAALVNGAMAHALDFDDNNMSMIGHSSAPVVPAVLALADEQGCTLADVISAYVAGVQVESVLGRIVGLEHNARGWHTTATLGTFGATAACARLLRLDEAAAQHALGLAASMASGLRQNFPSMTKALHAGFAAKNGVVAARLAAAGIRSAEDALDGNEGFTALFAGRKGGAASPQDLARFEILESFPKVYPTCAMVHQALDVLLEGIRSGQVKAGEVASVECEASYHALNIMRYPDPQSVPQARFSMQYCLAVALLEGEVTNAWFAADRIHDPRIRAAMQRVQVRLAPDQASKELFEPLYVAGKAFTRLRVRHHGGTEFTGEAALQKGHPGNPLDLDGFRAKFLACVAPARGAAGAQALWQTLVEADPQAPFAPAALLGRAG